MISIQKSKLENIYKVADEELTNAYIVDKERNIYGWRNGLKRENAVEPGATATALILNYFIFRGNVNIERDIRQIMRGLLKMQLEDEDTKKTGWEVMSLKSPNGGRVPSVDVTAIVLDTLQKNIHWLAAQEDEALQKEMKRAILEGGQWLYEQGKDGAWRIHEGDLKRIFVTCNVLQALVPLMGCEEFQLSLSFLKEAQNSDGSWGKAQSNNGEGDIYHTAKVLNLLHTYFRRDANSNIQKGVDYLKRAIADGLPISPPWLEEEIHDCDGNAKSYYHDRYGELLLLMQRTPCYWTRYEYFKVLETFVSLKENVGENQKFYETKTDKNLKKQIWLLVPAAKQSCEIVNRLFPNANQHICLSDNERLLGFDLEEEEKAILMDDEERREREREEKKKEGRKNILSIGVVIIIGIIIFGVRVAVGGINGGVLSLLDGVIGFLIGVFLTVMVQILSKRCKWLKGLERIISK